MGKKKARYVFAIELFTTIIALGSLITGTYAWYIAANAVTVDSFKITYGEADKIQFGLIVPENHEELGQAGQIKFFDELTEDDLISYGYYDKASTLSPCSSMFQSRWLNESTDWDDPSLLPVLRDSYQSYDNTTDTEIVETGFLQFEFILKSNVDMYLYLDDSASILADSFMNQKQSRNRSNDLDKVSKCLRVSFLSSLNFNIWEPNTEMASETAFGGRLDVLTPDGLFDYTGAAGNFREIVFGEYYNEEDIVYSENARAKATGTPDSYNASSAAKAAPFDLAASEAKGLIIGREKSKSTATLSDQTLDSSILAYLPEYTPTRLVVTVYAEGWDIDTTDLVQNANFLFNMTLTGRFRAPNQPILTHEDIA